MAEFCKKKDKLPTNVPHKADGKYIKEMHL